MNSFFYWLVFTILSISSLGAQNLPSGFSLKKIAGSIKGPTTMAIAPDGRIFICRQAGEIRVVKNDVLLTTPALKITVDSANEKGLLGIALDPAFSVNQYVYLYHTLPTTPARNRISRYTFNGDVITAASQVTVLDLEPLVKTNHHGGALAFGTDGKLYVAVGNNNDDGGNVNFVNPNALDLDTYFGKLLRINSDGSAPGDNPFPSGSEQRKRIWAYGLRNPYSIDVHSNGKILVNDVGNKSFEEINDATIGGLNFGWPRKEGPSSDPLYTNPLFAYPNVSVAGTAGDGIGCAITGGVFFNPTSTYYPAEYLNKYFYLDWCNGWINYIDHTLASPVANAFATNMPVTPATPYKYTNSAKNVILKVGADGNLYFLNGSNYGGTVIGALYKIEHSEPTGVYNSAALSDPLNVYPVPAKEVITIKWLSSFSGEGQLTLSNVHGTALRSALIQFSSGENISTLDVHQLKSGIYFLELKSEGSVIKKQKVLIGE